MSSKICYSDSHRLEWVLDNFVDGSNDFGLLAGDSRLWGMDRYMWDNLLLSQLYAIAYRGATIERLRTHIMRALVGFEDKYVTIKLCMGLNNILAGDSPGTVMSQLVDIKESILRRHRFAMVSFGDIAHVNFEKSSRTQHFSTRQANNRIDTVNNLIHIENGINHHSIFVRAPAAPFLASAVTRVVRRRDKVRDRRYNVLHRNDALLSDGIHVSPGCKRTWLKTFVKAFNKDHSTFAHINN